MNNFFPPNLTTLSNVLIGCPKPSDPENGKTGDKWYLASENANYHCSNGFQLNGTRQLCDGLNWLHPVPKCVRQIQEGKRN